MDIFEKPAPFLRFKYFIAGSLVAHVIMLGIIQLLPFDQELKQPEKPLIAKLVSPETLKGILPVRPPVVRTSPPIPDTTRKVIPPSEKHTLPDLKTPPRTIEDEGMGSSQEREKDTLAGEKRKGDSKKPTFREDLKVAEKKAIEKIVAESEEKKTKGEGKGNDAITFSTKEFKYYGYKTRLKEKIEGIWKYPREAAEKGIYGDLVIQFTILKDGSLGAIELIRTSGYKMLDDAALEALRDAAPFWPLPKEWTDNTFTIQGHFVYTLGGYYIR